MVEGHLGSGDEVTMVTTEVAADDAARYGIVQVAGTTGGSPNYALQARRAGHPTTATNEVFVFTPRAPPCPTGWRG